VLRDGGAAWKSLGEQLKALCNQVGSYYPQRENFRLTPEVKGKFTEKLRLIRGVLWARGQRSGSHRRTEAGFRRRLVGVLPAFGDGASGASVLGSAERAGLEMLSRAAKEWIFE